MWICIDTKGAIVMKKISDPISKHTQKYLMEHAILVIKEYSSFGLSKIQYINDDQSFTVDTKLISDAPIKEKTISIQLLGG